jgi:DEAD/DEAH box helicase domain-containing protein
MATINNNNLTFFFRNKTVLDSVDLDSPPWEQTTTGFWLDVSYSLLSLFRQKRINAAEAVHAAQHAIMNRFSLAQDLRTECKLAEKEYRFQESTRKRPAR